MNEYQIVYKTSDGFVGIEYVYAANRIAAFMVFEELGYEDVIEADCFCVFDEEDGYEALD